MKEKNWKKKTIQSIEDYLRQILIGEENNYNLQSKYENNNIIKKMRKKIKIKKREIIGKKVKAKKYYMKRVLIIKLKNISTKT